MIVLSALASTDGMAAKGFDSSKYAAIVIEIETGDVLFSRRADSQRYPASLTKIMTLYELFQALEAGQLSLNDTLPVSANAARQPPSRLGLSAGSRIKVEDAILALVVQSANDVAVAVAEALGGSERGFAAQMTDQARALGMTRTVYRNASGLPNPGQVTTARDLAILCQALINDFPQYYGYFATETLSLGGHLYKTHNHLLGKVDGLDGIKTGYTRASGFNLAASASRDGRRLIAVVLGGPSVGERDQHMRQLVQENFTVLAKREPGATETLMAELPTPRPKPVLTASLETPAAEAAPGLPAPKPGGFNNAIDAVAAYVTPQANPQAAQAQGSSEEDTSGIGALIAPPAMASTDAGAPARDAGDRWGIQIGAYMSPSAAESRLEDARAAVPKLLSNTPWAVIPVTTDGAVFYRARFGPFTEDEATNACDALGPHGFKCFKVPPEDIAALSTTNPEGSVP
jgi:D-alanyl-D-alanine carboxypeptidase